MKIIVDPLLSLPIDSVLPLLSYTFYLSFRRENSVVALKLYLHYITSFYLNYKLHCMNSIIVRFT